MLSDTLMIVPCYNEEERLDAKAFLEYSQKTGVRFLFVNDGSRDGTLHALAKLCKQDPGRLNVLDCAKNKGKAEAVRQGILSSLQRGDLPRYIGYWDCDLATPLSDIRIFRDILESKRDLEMVLGSRVLLLGRDIRRRAHRHYLGRIFATFASALILKIRVYDTQCGAKLFRVTPNTGKCFAQPFIGRWVFDVEVLQRFCHFNRDIPAEQKIHEHPLMCWHDIAGSKVGPRAFFESAYHMLRLYFNPRTPH